MDDREGFTLWAEKARPLIAARVRGGLSETRMAAALEAGWRRLTREQRQARHPYVSHAQALKQQTGSDMKLRHSAGNDAAIVTWAIAFLGGVTAIASSRALFGDDADGGDKGESGEEEDADSIVDVVSSSPPPLFPPAPPLVLPAPPQLLPSEGRDEPPPKKQRKPRRPVSEYERPFPCLDPGCNKAYASKAARRLHIKTKHPEIHDVARG